MAGKNEQQLLVSLDIGTSKIVTLVGDVQSDNQIHIVGMGISPSHGLKHGVVVDIEETVASIGQSVKEAETTAGCEINSAFTGIAGKHINSVNSHGVVAVRSHEILQADVDRVIDAAKAVPIPAEHKILHIIPQDFVIDNQSGIKDPIGMAGVRLEAKVHIVTGAISAAQNIVKCVQRCGLQPADIILEQLASSYSVLTEDEKELGVCLVDIGGGTTDVAVYVNGALRHTFILPVAGDQVTQDLAIALRIPTQHAENIKLQHGCALIDNTAEDDLIELHDLGEINPHYLANRPISKYMLAEVMEPRYEELFYLINQQIKTSGLKDYLGAGIVLTGGASLAPGVIDLAMKEFALPIRIGTPRTCKGYEQILTNPMYATSVGLLNYGFEQHFVDHLHDQQHLKSIKNTWSKIKNWFNTHL